MDDPMTYCNYTAKNIATQYSVSDEFELSSSIIHKKNQPQPATSIVARVYIEELRVPRPKDLLRGKM